MHLVPTIAAIYNFSSCICERVLWVHLKMFDFFLKTLWGFLSKEVNKDSQQISSAPLKPDTIHIIDREGI